MSEQTRRPRALVTGGARRVGRAIVVELARAGWDVLIHCHQSGDDGQQALTEVAGHGGTATLIEADLSDPAGCEAVVRAVQARWDGLELLVNNASVFAPRPFAEIDAAHWAWMQDVNLRAPFLLAQGLLGRLNAGDLQPGGPTRACIVNLCDIGAERPVSGYTAYSVSKAGLVMLTRSLAVELAPAIRTVAVSPGQVAWPEDYSEALRTSLTRRIPMGRAGEPEDVARLVRFLAMEAHYLNGVVVPVDGGLHVRY